MDAKGDVTVGKQTINKDFESDCKPYTYGLVPQLSKV